MGYKFIYHKDTCSFQLIKEGWLRDSKLDIYLSKNHFNRYCLSITYNNQHADMQHMSSTAAMQIMDLLDKLKIKKRDLMNAKFPKDADTKALNDLGQIVAFLSVVS